MISSIFNLELEADAPTFAGVKTLKNLQKWLVN